MRLASPTVVGAVEGAPLAQLDRASVYGTEGYRFESCAARLWNLEAGELRETSRGSPVSCAPGCDTPAKVAQDLLWSHGLRR